MNAVVLAVALLTLNEGGIELTVEGETAQIDPGRSVFLDVTLRSGAADDAVLPDLRDRVRGFSLAEDNAEEPVTEADGRVRQTAHWRLVPEPCAEVYKIAPFAAGGKVAGPIYFEPPPAPDGSAKGPLEIDPKKDLPPLSWRLVGRVCLWLFALCLAAGAAWFGIRYLARRVREHRMSPIERAWVELDRLLKKGLPGRGRYKDFYVELTQLVRRYIQRKYGIKAPTLTTEEFLATFKAGAAASVEALREFLQSADMVKFAGVEATPEMTDAATDSARSYLTGDNAAKEEAR